MAAALQLLGEDLATIMRWSAVLNHARFVCELTKEQAVTLAHAELGDGLALLRFERRVGGRDNREEHVACIDVCVFGLEVQHARDPVVWQMPICRAVQKLCAEVPALGFAVREEPYG